MGATVELLDDARVVLVRADTVLAGDPVRCNVIATLLTARAEQPEPGRYWLVGGIAGVAGVVFQSPLHFAATVTPMPVDAVDAAVDAIVAAGVELPGVTGEAATVARFAGAWTERTRSAAVPHQGQRIYEVAGVVPPAGVPGRVRVGTAADRDTLIRFLIGFMTDTGEASARAASATIDRRLPAGELWLWDDGGPVSMAALSPPVHGVVRVQAVYTPPERRTRGYASACVAALSSRVLAGGDRCILYTDLGNRTSNAIYRDIGYRAVTEVLRYHFPER